MKLFKSKAYGKFKKNMSNIARSSLRRVTKQKKPPPSRKVMKGKTRIKNLWGSKLQKYKN